MTSKLKPSPTTTCQVRPYFLSMVSLINLSPGGTLSKKNLAAGIAELDAQYEMKLSAPARAELLLS